MNKLYSRINWKNYPSEDTSLDEANLNRMDLGLDNLDNRVIEMDAIKVNKEVANTLIKNWTMDEATGVITVEKLNGEKIIFDLNIEKIPVDFKLSEDGILTMTTDDGTKFTANIGAMIPVLTFEDSDEIAVSVSGSGVNKTYSFSIKAGSVTEDKLQPNFLADVKSEVTKAQASATSAATSETNAKTSETNSKASETAAKTSENNAQASETAAASSASTASTKASEASTSATNAKTSETNAKASETAAASSASTASTKANTATTKASAAATSATNASNSAKASESYARGGTGTRTGEDTDNAKYYYEQTKQVSQSLNGIIPKGTVAFANLPTSGMQYGDMYNISDAFMSDTRFNDGGGVYYGAGNNVIWVSGDKWDVTAGSGVTGVKGANEDTYRQGNVNITPENIGLGNVGNFKAVSTVASQGLTDTEKLNARANIGAGTSSFSGSYNDLSDKPFSVYNANEYYYYGNVVEYEGKIYRFIKIKSGGSGGTKGIVPTNTTYWKELTVSDLFKELSYATGILSTLTSNDFNYSGNPANTSALPYTVNESLSAIADTLSTLNSIGNNRRQGEEKSRFPS